MVPDSTGVQSYKKENTKAKPTTQQLQQSNKSIIIDGLDQDDPLRKPEDCISCGKKQGMIYEPCTHNKRCPNCGQWGDWDKAWQRKNLYDSKIKIINRMAIMIKRYKNKISILEKKSRLSPPQLEQKKAMEKMLPLLQINLDRAKSTIPYHKNPVLLNSIEELDSKLNKVTGSELEQAKKAVEMLP